MWYLSYKEQKKSPAYKKEAKKMRLFYSLPSVICSCGLPGGGHGGYMAYKSTSGGSGGGGGKGGGSGFFIVLLIIAFLIDISSCG